MKYAAVQLLSAAIVAASLAVARDARGEAPAPASASIAPASVVPDTREAPQLVWDPRWPRFRNAEYVATGLLGVMAFASLVIPPSEERWTEINDFDASARSALRIESTRLRSFARDASDLSLILMLNQLSVDALLVTWWRHGRGSIAWELAMMDFEALALNAALNGMVAGLTSRERPYREGCTGPEPRQNSDCRNSKRYRSFFSGHTSTAFTTAGLVCSHHAHLPLYGGGAPDVLACAASFAAAATVGTLRVVSDQHFTTDVLTGAAVGTLTGLGLPWLLHYRGGATPDVSARPAGATVGFVPAPLGGAIVGVF